MVPGKANQRVIADRLDGVQRMTDEIRALPLDSPDAFTGDRRNIGPAESCLRRAIEALLDLGRHLLAKVFGDEEAPGMYRYRSVNPVQLPFYPCHRIPCTLVPGLGCGAKERLACGSESGLTVDRAPCAIHRAFTFLPVHPAPCTVHPFFEKKLMCN